MSELIKVIDGELKFPEGSSTSFDTYRIECLECGSIAFGDPSNDPERDAEYHRDHHCPEAEFEVSEL
jgi:hypothetical protein